MSRFAGIICIWIAICAADSVCAAEDFSTWAHSAKLTLNTTSTGANLARGVGNYGLLVRITDSRILTQSMATGADVRFADAMGVPLVFQIERWTPAAGKAEFWVYMPMIDPLSDKQYLNVYWGKPGSAWMSDANKVFTSPTYNMVYHLGEASTQARTNSVGNYNHAAPKNYEGDERVQGLIGMADSLDGSLQGGDHLALGAAFTDLTQFTFTAWAKPSGPGKWERFLDFGNGEGVDNLLFTRANASDLVLDVYGTPTQSGGLTKLGQIITGKTLEQDKWALYGFILNGKSVEIYKNGERVMTGELKAPLNRVARTLNFIGHSNWPGDSHFKGVFDEIQLTNGTHSPEWMRLSYESQRPDAKMFSWEFPAEVKLSVTTQPVGISVSEGKTAKLWITAVSSMAIAYQWFRDGAALPGEIGAEYSVPSVTLENAGAYTCRVTDGIDTVLSKPAALSVPEDLSTWSHSQKVFINTTATGAVISGEVVNIPILIRLGKNSIDFSQIGAGGKDLRFRSSDGIALAHSIERWDADTAEVWVRVNKVLPNANGFILMYWGKTAATQASSPGNVFSLNDSWRVYYEFSDAPSGSGDTHAKDATLNSWSGQGIGVTSLSDCVIGKCFGLTGASHMETPAAAMQGLKTYTVLAWVREKAAVGQGAGVQAYPHFFSTKKVEPAQGDFGTYSQDGVLRYWNGMKSTPSWFNYAADFKLTDHGWHQVAITYSGSSMTLYGDGIVLGISAGENVSLGANVLALGGSRTASGTWEGLFSVDIDAVQVTGDAKGEDWIKLAYETQRPGSHILAFGAPADLPPPDPEIYPPAGDYAEAVLVQITCAADSARILYTLDGSEPDTVARGATRNFGSGFFLYSDATVQAKAYWKGKASPVAMVTYWISIPGAIGDTLHPGATKVIDATHRITFPNQDSKSPVRLTAGPDWNPLPNGFDRVGPLFTLTAVDTAAAFPGLLVEGDSLAGLSLFRRHPNNAIFWTPPRDGQLWIPTAGTFFWARDTLPPRIKYAGAMARGDSILASIIIDDNVAVVQGMVRFWNGGEDSLGWWSAAAGSTLEFTLPIPAKPETPLEARFSATDQSRTATFPESRNLTLPRPLPALAAPLALKSGIQWKMAGLPLLATGAVSMRDLANMSGTGPLYAAIWRSVPAPDTGYLILKGEDTLPKGRGFWLAAQNASPTLNIPASHALPSDSDGLFTLKLEKGWNLVTCPSFRPLAWPVSTKDGDAYLRSPLKPLHGMAESGYSRPDSLRPWEAYYVWYDKDTTVRVGPGAPRVSNQFPAPKAATLAKSLRLNLAGPGALLDLGASTFARAGLGREDESRPPPIDRSASAWLAREGRALTVDYVAWDPERAMAWTVATRDQAAGASFSIIEATLPPGYEAWAVSPTRRLKWPLLPGGNIPVTGDDTLSIYAGTPRALAKIGDLQRGRPAAGAFAARLRPAAGGLELILDLPSQARVTLTLHDARGQRLARLAPRDLAPGRHDFSWQSLSQGAYFLTLHAQGPDWTRHQIQPITLIH
ncbi:MAG: DUF2341 domain-containing protein [Fibrobacteria bacterium]